MTKDQLIMQIIAACPRSWRDGTNSLKTRARRNRPLTADC